MNRIEQHLEQEPPDAAAALAATIGAGVARVVEEVIHQARDGNLEDFAGDKSSRTRGGKAENVSAWQSAVIRDADTVLSLIRSETTRTVSC
jgi:hypothetical protein